MLGESKQGLRTNKLFTLLIHLLLFYVDDSGQTKSLETIENVHKDFISLWKEPNFLWQNLNDFKEEFFSTVP